MKHIIFNTVGAVSAGAIAVSCASITEQKHEHPNILFICIDDLRTELGAYGCAEVLTPNLDALAAEGRLFTHQYVQAPTSGASRAFMLTGMGATHRHEVGNFVFTNRLIGSQEGEKPETFVHHLRRNGYHTVGMGKVSHSDNGHIHHEGERLRELPYSWDEFINDPTSPWPDTFDAMLHGYDNGRTRIQGVSPAYEFLELPDTCYADGRLANLAISQLDSLSKSDKPFFMAVGFYKPHLPFTAPKKYWNLYEDIDISLAPNVGIPEGVDEVFIPTSGEFFNQYSHREMGGKGITLSEEYSKDLRRAYYSSISYTDAQVGKVLNKLKESGLDKNTIVVVWGDHGWHLGDNTAWGKHSVFERALNSTLIVKTPTDMEQRGESSDQLIAAVDLYPTICELAGVETPEGLDGVSFVEQIHSPATQGRDYVISYWQGMMSIRTDRYRFSIFDNGKRVEKMLFDHQNDPNETRNIASQEAELVEWFTSLAAENSRGEFLPITEASINTQESTN